MTEMLTTCVAIILASAAAILSAPGHSDRTQRVEQWLQVSYGGEADVLAAAIGETPETHAAP
jgi:hypothetical protein